MLGLPERPVAFPLKAPLKLGELRVLFVPFQVKLAESVIAAVPFPPINILPDVKLLLPVPPLSTARVPVLIFPAFMLLIDAPFPDNVEAVTAFTVILGVPERPVAFPLKAPLNVGAVRTEPFQVKLACCVIPDVALPYNICPDVKLVNPVPPLFIATVPFILAGFMLVIEKPLPLKFVADRVDEFHDTPSIATIAFVPFPINN